jgi:hypothetical protein
MSFTASSTKLKLVTYQGNTENITIDVRTFAGNKPLSLGSASKVLLHVEDPRAGVEYQIEASSTATGADWAKGVVIVTLPGSGATPVLEKVGSFRTSLIAVIGIEVLTVASGQLEVRNRPGYPYPS